jgi:hypothetical protein
MTVTAETTVTGVSVPSTERPTARLPVWLGWSLALLALLAAAALVTVALRSDDPDTVMPAHSGIIEHGSPVAVDHQAEVGRPTSPASADVSSAEGGDHSQIIEHGSPTAVDHAAEEAGNG